MNLSSWRHVSPPLTECRGALQDTCSAWASVCWFCLRLLSLIVRAALVTSASALRRLVSNRQLRPFHLPCLIVSGKRACPNPGISPDFLLIQISEKAVIPSHIVHLCEKWTLGKGEAEGWGQGGEQPWCGGRGHLSCCLRPKSGVLWPTDYLWVGLSVCTLTTSSGAWMMVL